MAASHNRSPGAARNKVGVGGAAESSRRWLPKGVIWGAKRKLLLLARSLFSCVVSRLEGSTRTLLLTRTLRENFNSSLNMAPVIKPSGEGGGGTYERRKD